MRKVKKILIIASMALGVIFVIILTTLLFTGAFSGDKFSRIVAVMKGEELAEAEAEKKGDDYEKIYFDYKTKMQQKEAEIKAMEQKLNDLRRYTNIRLQEMEKLNNELMSINEELNRKRNELKAFTDNWEAKQRDQNFTLNLSRFQKMEPEAVADIMKMLQDDEVRLYLNNMKPAFVAEVIDVMRLDTAFKDRLEKILFDIKEIGKNTTK